MNLAAAECLIETDDERFRSKRANLGHDQRFQHSRNWALTFES